MNQLLIRLAAAFAVLAPLAAAQAIDEAHRAKAERIADKAVAYLKSKQDKETGGWSVPAQGENKPHLPAMTALAINGMLMGPKDQARDPAVAQGVKYLLNFVQPDGGIYDRMLPSYNTALSVSALSRVDLPQAREAVERGVKFLQGLQWSESADGSLGGTEAPRAVKRDHVFYGGVGYGKHGRPDGSNLNMFMQAMQDGGVSPGDESVKRALVFLQRLQMLDEVNDMPYADKSRQGGFIYATVENAESVEGRAGQSHAGVIEESLDDGTKVSRLRCYGSMTYAGFKSYLYAELPRDDVRVTAALDWISRHYTLEENPGMGSAGLYYYFVTFSRALAAWGQPKIDVVAADGTRQSRDWANDVIDRLADLQNEDGSFKSVNERWMEKDPVLITTYGLIAARTAAAADAPKLDPADSPAIAK